jgi:hypothetical protein
MIASRWCKSANADTSTDLSRNLKPSPLGEGRSSGEYTKFRYDSFAVTMAAFFIGSKL